MSDTTVMLRRLVSEAVTSGVEIVDPASMKRAWRRVEFETTLRRHPTYVIARTGRRDPAYVAGKPQQALRCTGTGLAATR